MFARLVVVTAALLAACGDSTAPADRLTPDTYKYDVGQYRGEMVIAEVTDDSLVVGFFVPGLEQRPRFNVLNAGAFVIWVDQTNGGAAYVHRIRQVAVSGNFCERANLLLTSTTLSCSIRR